MADSAAFLTSRLRRTSQYDNLRMFDERVMRAEERQPEDEEVQGEMTDDRPEMPDSLAGVACVGSSVTGSRRR